MSAVAPPVADAATREEALHPDRSFIVQAPAGSGKTELLIQRLLVLLATVERPEQVLAITFTRKAAAEMRTRLLEALSEAAQAPEAAGLEDAADDLKAATLRRARAVVARDRARGWELLASPGRLRIQTIDALCSALARERPVLSGLGETPAIADDPAALYQDAARDALAALETGGPTGDAVERLLLHLDDDQARAESLLASLLGRRDQWLRHLRPEQSPAALRQALETELRAAVDEEVVELHASLRAFADAAGLPLEAELAVLAPPAARQVAARQPDAPIARLAALTGLPDPVADALPLWRGLAELFTTAKGTWRQRLDKRQGFPTDKDAGDPAALKALKQRAQDLLTRLQARPEPAEALRRAAALPPPAYTDAQWAVLEALLALLPRAAERLGGTFAEAGELDYGEVALGAIRALQAALPTGPAPPDAPRAQPLRDEARHILVDEFQDTSHSQFRLLECLTEHWPTDGSHTLFLVGDPMQSIYRFREAEVGLFLRAQREGIGPVRLHPLRLEVNFRSTGPLVSWVNAVFPGVLAPAASLGTGAVPFAPSTPHRRDAGGPGVVVHALPAGASREVVAAEEARAVAAVIAAHRRERPGASLAVLVRTRAHLPAILPALQHAGLPFQAVEIETLAERPEVQDLLMLLRALTHPGDRVAWLAVLRAPWCGLSLEALLRLAAPGAGGLRAAPTLWERLGDPAVRAGLPPDAQARAARLVTALAPSLATRERRSLRRWLEGAWLALGGPACVPETAWPNVEACLARLDTLPAAAPPPGPEQVQALLERLYAAPDPQADPALQVMSIHKAKGLQFDTVLLPGLGRVPRADETPLLRWFERPQAAPGGAGLLLAPIPEAGQEGDGVFDYLKRLEQDKAHHETGRLLYVAVTRAERALHLFGQMPASDHGAGTPPRRSLLERLWPALEPDFTRAADEAGPDGPADGTSAPPPPEVPTLHRLAADWEPPAVPPGVMATHGPRAPDDTAPPAEAHEIEFRWAGEVARHVGTVVHRLLCQMARHAPDRWQPGQGAFSARAVAASLGALGVPAAEQPAATERVLEALERTLADERGRWVLAPRAEAYSEYALTGWVDGHPGHFVIDRTFVDEAGVRWIVDFKTGRHEGGDLEAFLTREQARYREQLEGYAALMAALEPDRPIRLGLYFPLLQAWREWAPPPSAGASADPADALP